MLRAGVAGKWPVIREDVGLSVPGVCVPLCQPPEQAPLLLEDGSASANPMAPGSPRTCPAPSVWVCP